MIKANTRLTAFFHIFSFSQYFVFRLFDNVVRAKRLETTEWKVRIQIHLCASVSKSLQQQRSVSSDNDKCK